MLNPLQVLRQNDEDILKKELQELEISELNNIIKKYCPDPSRRIYRSKKKEKIIEYILYRADCLISKYDAFM